MPETHEERDLSRAIEALYDACRNVPQPRFIDACSCCVEDSEIVTLLRKSPRHLSPQELASYSSSVFLTAGSRFDFLYFLPRILEISIQDPDWWPSPEVVGRAIASGEPDSWSPEIVESVLAVFECQVARLVRCNDPGLDLDTWVCAAGKAGFDVIRLLQIVETSPRAVVSFFAENEQALRNDRLRNSFWNSADLGYSKTLRWFRSDFVVRALDRLGHGNHREASNS